MTPQDAFKLWHPDTLCPTHEESFEAGWKAAMDFIRPQLMDMAASRINPPIVLMDSQVRPEDIYNAYPRKVGKQGAIKAIERAIAREVPSFMEAAGGVMPCTPATAKSDAAKEILTATQAYATAVSKWPAADKQFIPHPATWFNRGSYDDDPAEWNRCAPTTQTIKTRN